MEEVDEKEIFEGSENRLTLEQTYTHEFQCLYRLQSYPFDKQECSINMKTTKLDNPMMMLFPKNLWMDQDPDMTLYSMKNWDITYRNGNDPKKGIWMTIVLRRKIMSEMLTTYLPSVLLMMITFATTFFKPFFFEAALSVNLTNMLVMTTIFISVMEKLPLTSYPKMIDYWLIFCQLVPFVEVILLTAMEYLREEVVEKEEETTAVTSRIEVIAHGENPEETETGNSEIIHTMQAWPNQQKKVSLENHIKTIGKYTISHLYPSNLQLVNIKILHLCLTH